MLGSDEVSLQPVLNLRNPCKGLTTHTIWGHAWGNVELGSFHPVLKPSKTKSLLQPPAPPARLAAGLDAFPSHFSPPSASHLSL